MATATDWAEWSERLWNSMEQRFGYPGLAHLEQLMLRSKRDQCCVSCGDHGTERQPGRGLVASVSHYWMCPECDEHYNGERRRLAS